MRATRSSFAFVLSLELIPAAIQARIAVPLLVTPAASTESPQKAHVVAKTHDPHLQLIRLLALDIDSVGVIYGSAMAVGTEGSG